VEREEPAAYSVPIVRFFRPADVGAVVVISGESPESANWSKESYLKLVEENGSIALVIEAAGNITAFLVGKRAADQAEIFNLAVKGEHRRKGMGTAILSAALKEFALENVKSVYLEARESNTNAIAFYEKCGFTKTGRRNAYYRDPDEAALTMVKELKG